MNKFFLLTGLIITACLNAQVLYEYPKDQDFYEGGRQGFYNDLQQVVKKNNYKACDKTEVLFMRFIVYPDNTIKYVSDPDTKAVENNKCMKDKVLNAIKQTTKWKAAEVDGKKTAAMFLGIFYDDLLFKNPVDESDFTMPVYMYKDKESNITKFRENFTKCFDINGYNPIGDYSFIINFDVDTDGEAGFFYIENQSNLEQFNEMVVKCASNTKKSYWKPGLYKGIPVKRYFRFPIRFNAQ